MGAESLKRQAGRNPGATQTLTYTAQTEDANGAAPAYLDRAEAEALLRERGYELVERFGHIHAAAGTWEWHVCLLTNLVSMPPASFLALLEESIKHSLQSASAR